MKIKTRDFGEIQVQEDAIYSFPNGIYGFENHKEFAVFYRTCEDINFIYLQSTQDKDPCFLVFNPSFLYPDFTPIVNNDNLKLCEVKSTSELIFLAIATVPKTIRDMTLNIKSPVVLNPKTKKGRQILLDNPDYKVKYKPFHIEKEGD